MNADELFEVAYCKGKREAMKMIVRWLKEHTQITRESLEEGVSHESALKLLLKSMDKSCSLLDEELEKGVVLLSLQEKKLQKKNVQKKTLQKAKANKKK